MKENLTESQIREKIEMFRNNFSKDGKAYFEYYSTLLTYNREKSLETLRKNIRKKLEIKEVGGKYSAKDISTVLDISVSEVKRIENKMIRIMKAPKNSMKLRKYLLRGD